jgi:regulatory protein
VSAKDEAAAKAYVERLVTYRPRTVAEVRRRLAAKGFPPEVARAALSYAEDAGLVNDALFARLYAEDRVLSRPCARRLIAQELRERGVEAMLADQAALAALSDLTEADLARRALAARMPLWQNLAPDVARNRAAAFLLRRGFSPALARQIVDEALGEGWTSA